MGMDDTILIEKELEKCKHCSARAGLQAFGKASALAKGCKFNTGGGRLVAVHDRTLLIKGDI